MKSKKYQMAWNEPKNSGNKNPWGNGGDMPDLEAWLKKIQSKISNTKLNEPGEPDKNIFRWVIIGIILIVIIYIISGFYIVEPQEEAVVLQFGKYHKTVMPGPHWIPRFISSAIVINVQGIQNYSYHANMLTKDENIVDVSIAVQYRIRKPEAYLFNVNNPIISLQQATASALRQVIGNTPLDSILTSGRAEISAAVKAQLINLLTRYQTGIEVTQVALQPAKAPEAVKDAFDDAIKAQEDEERYINQAQAYRMQVIPEANGQQDRILANADAYKKQVVLNAQGETARYLALLPQYLQNPVVTRERLYLGALQTVMSHTTKIYIDQNKGNSTLFYLPIDKLLAEKDKVSMNEGQGTLVPLTSTDTAETQPAPAEAETNNANKVANNFPGYGPNETYGQPTEGGR